MLTGDKFANIVLKRLMDKEHFKDYFLDYLKDSSVATLSHVYDKDGTFHATTKVAISADGNDKFALADDKDGTDGDGHLLTTDRTSPAYDAYCDAVQFENTDTIIYDIALTYAEKPDGVAVNPRTGVPEYQRFEEVVGFADEPAAVSDEGSQNVKIVLPDTMCDNDRTHAGRKAVAWKVVPGADGESEAVSVQEQTVVFSGGVNYITVSQYLGDAAFDSDKSNYVVCLLGPIVTRQSEKDLEAASGYWYMGEIEGDGAGNPPINPDVTNQRLITKSLSDLLENLVYDNVANTFTKKQTIVSDSGVGLDVTGNGSEAGVLGKGGATNGPGIVGQGGGTNGGGLSGEGKGTGAGVDGTAVDGYAVLAATANNVRASLRVVPQGAEPSVKDDGADYVSSPSKKRATCLNGEFRTYSEQKKSRTFLYPIACGVPDQQVTEPHWYWHSSNHYWNSDNLVTPEYIVFDLNRFVPQGATLYSVRLYVDPGTTRAAKGDRTRVQLLSEDALGASQTEHFRSYYPSGTVNTPDWLNLIGGQHDGAGDAAVLTDSWQAWTVNELVGRTVYNLTDGSSGTITANTATTATATLSGGTDDDWDVNDEYKIDLDEELTSATRQWYLMLWSGNDNQVDILHSIEIQYIENEYTRVP